MPNPNTLHVGQLLRIDGFAFVVETIDGDDVYVIQLARPGEHVARGPWIYSKAQFEALLGAQSAIVSTLAAEGV
jgi:hypothetical protein